jgi:hypothetical protein
VTITPKKHTGERQESYKNCNCCIGPHLLKSGSAFPNASSIVISSALTGLAADIAAGETGISNTKKPMEPKWNFSLLREALARLRKQEAEKLGAAKNASKQEEEPGKDKVQTLRWKS